VLLKKLTISSDNEIIREIFFHPKGVSLIVSDGNSVGKTTTLRAVDFCFGSEGKDIYQDPEFGTDNIEVKNYLFENEVKFQLYLADNSSQEFVLTRQLTTHEKERFWINEESVKNLRTYRIKLAQQLLNLVDAKPTIRTLMPKFIRKEEQSKNNTIKYLHPSTRLAEYEMLRLFLFGFSDKELLAERLSTQQEVTQLNNKKKTLEDRKSQNEARQVVRIIEKDIKAQEKEINEFKLNEAYEDLFKKLTNLKGGINRVSGKITDLQMRISLNKETLEQLQDNIADIEIDTIRELYEEAQSLVPNLIQKSFEETLQFHNGIIFKRIEFVEKGLEKSRKQLKTLEKDLKYLLSEERKILKELKSKGSLSDLQKLQTKLHELHEKKGKENQFIELMKSVTKEFNVKKQKLDELNTRIENYKSDFDDKVAIFNGYFSEYSNTLYDEQYYIYYDASPKSNVQFNFQIGNIESNVGGGKKKAQITAFDLAYISFIHHTGLAMPKFVMHDSIEDIEITQIQKLFQIGNQIEGQYIIALLKDKLEGYISEDELKKYTILELSETDKFFSF